MSNFGEFLRFILSSFWVWLGFLILMFAACEGVAEIIRAIKPARRTVDAQKVGNVWRYRVEGATGHDVQTLIYGTRIEAAVDEAEGADHEGV